MFFCGGKIIIQKNVSPPPQSWGLWKCRCIALSVKKSWIFSEVVPCCNKVEFYTRHQVIVKCLTAFVAASGIRTTNEVQVGGRERPADIFLDRWTTTEPAAVDVTVTHLLAPQPWAEPRLGYRGGRGQKRGKNWRSTRT